MYKKRRKKWEIMAPRQFSETLLRRCGRLVAENADQVRFEPTLRPHHYYGVGKVEGGWGGEVGGIPAGRGRQSGEDRWV